MARTPNRKLAPRIAPTIQSLRSNLEDLLEGQLVPAAEYQARSHKIQEIILNESRQMGTENFRATSATDLRRMAELYDTYFFDDSCLALAHHFGMTFRWSSRMTKAGGKTTRFSTRRRLFHPPETRYEITLSSSLIFQTFQKDDRQIRVCGCPCNNRLQAMQRIVEHELIHLGEMLAWNNSDCAAQQFQSIAYRFFGHTEHRHELVTQRERAAKLYSIKLGARVSFIHDGKRLTGVVNRITRRATVLVESPKGVKYNDGKCYQKFYIPLANLKPA
jgi:hypothetical protein